MLFCDLVGSTTLSERLDPEDLREILQEFQATAAEEIRRFGGHVAQHLGDGLLVYFGFPRAFEDSPRRAVDAALAILDAVAALDRRLDGLRPWRLEVRMGVHTGRVVTGEMGSGDRREHLALGEAPNVAARLQGLAEPGTVLISGVTEQLVRGFFDTEALGQREVRGLSRPVELFRVRGARDARDRFEATDRHRRSPHVGRRMELAALVAGLEQAQQGLGGDSLLLVGEAGIGKSRLVLRLRERLDEETALWIAHCSSYHGASAFYPVIELLHDLAGLDRESPVMTRLFQLEAFLSETAPEIADGVARPLAELLFLAEPEPTDDPTARRRQREETYDALVRLVTRAARDRPLVLVVEDLHWSDPSTLELLERLVDRPPEARLLLVMTSRPEIESTWDRRVTTVRLDRLKDDDARRVIVGRPGGGRLPPTVVDRLVAKADGVPLFLEELSEMALDTDWAADLDDTAVRGRATLELDIPATLHDSLAARLDRLGPGKTLAQWASVLGREFSAEDLTTLFDTEGMIDDGLAELEASGLVHPVGSRYIFKHALVRDVAYASLLNRRRIELHGQIARGIVSRFPETAAAQPELVAHHYSEAKQPLVAAGYWLTAGRRSTERSANREAMHHFQRGIDLLEVDGDDALAADGERLLLDLHQDLGPVAMAVEGYGSTAVETTYRRAIELSDRLYGRDGGDTRERFSAFLGLLRYHGARAQFDGLRELGEELLRMAEVTGEASLLQEALRPLGGMFFHIGDFERSVELLDRTLALYDAEAPERRSILHAEDPGVFCVTYSSWALWYMGQADRALARARDALARAEALANPFSQAHATSYAALLHQLRREPGETLTMAERTLELASEHDFAHRLAMGRFLHGWARTALDPDPERGLAEMEEGLAAWDACGAKVLRPQLLTLLARGHLAVGDAQEATLLLDQAEAAVAETGEVYYDSGVAAARGEVHLDAFRRHGRPEDRDRARQRLEEAREIARRQGAYALDAEAAEIISRLP